MRHYVTGLAVMLGAVSLYQGLVLRGLIDGTAGLLDPETAILVILAGHAMGLAAATVRWSAGIAAVEMALAGAAVTSTAGPHHRADVEPRAPSGIGLLPGIVVAACLGPGCYRPMPDRTTPTT